MIDQPYEREGKSIYPVSGCLQSIRFPLIKCCEWRESLWSVLDHSPLPFSSLLISPSPLLYPPWSSLLPFPALHSRLRWTLQEERKNGVKMSFTACNYHMKRMNQAEFERFGTRNNWKMEDGGWGRGWQQEV